MLGAIEREMRSYMSGASDSSRNCCGFSAGLWFQLLGAYLCLFFGGELGG